MNDFLTRRLLLTSAMLGSASTVLSGCQRIAEAPVLEPVRRFGEHLTMGAQRLLLAHRPLVREFSKKDISKWHPTTGTVMPEGAGYAQLLANGFRDFRLRVGGLVQRPLSWSLEQLRRLPSRTQITQHQCDEGWSAIGEWTGVPVGHLLSLTGLQPEARYIVFHCLDTKDSKGEHYYESLDLFDAFHPQTLLAYGMNGSELPVPHGAPLRLRAELHIGYKNAKYVESLEAVADLAHLRGGHGSYWADRGFQWYAGM